MLCADTDRRAERKGVRVGDQGDNATTDHPTGACNTVRSGVRRMGGAATAESSPHPPGQTCVRSDPGLRFVLVRGYCAAVARALSSTRPALAGVNFGRAHRWTGVVP